MQKRSRLAVRQFVERARRQVRSARELRDAVSRWYDNPAEPSRQTVDFWLSGRHLPPAWILFALAEEFNLDLSQHIAGQSWEERLIATERQLAVQHDQLAVLRDWALTQGMQATSEQMTSDR